MFTYLKAKNYKSLEDIQFNISKGGKPKKLAIIYGENGSGKSNLASIFYTLTETLRTMNFRNMIQDFLQDSNEDEDEKTDVILKFIKKNFRDTENIIKSVKTINSKENMILEYGFQINNNDGNYILETDNERIVREELNYRLDKNRGCLFKILSDNVKVNPKVFKNKNYSDELNDNIEKFWGKHTLLSILLNELQDKADGYLNKQLNDNILEVLEFFATFCCRVKVGNSAEKGRAGLKYKILQQLEEGKIEKSSEGELIKAEELLNEFFTSLYSDVKEVYYKKEEEGEKLEYKLYFRKMISDKIIDIDFNLESTGTQKLLSLMPFILSAASGNVVVIDEFDSGIHDLLVENLILNINDTIKGQLIITTHNTMIMESGIDKDSLYVLISDVDGNKSIKCIDDFEKRVHPNNNIRNGYINGLYRGIPSMMDIDFEELLDIFEE